MPRSGPGLVTGLPSTVNAAGLDRDEAADQIKKRRFAATGRAEQREEFLRPHVERNVFERQHRPAIRRPVQVADLVDDDLRLIGHDVLYSLAVRTDGGGTFKPPPA